MADPVRVLIAEDSPTARALMAAILDADPQMQVIGEAGDGAAAVEMTAALRPSIVVMDIEMPGMDGFEATRRIMVETPTPILIVTARRDARDVELSLRAERLGALSVLPKPQGPGGDGFARDAARLTELAKALADVRVVRRRRAASPPREAPAPVRARSIGIVGVAASTGGPPALYGFLEALPVELGVPVLVVQHIADGFLPGLASWLATATALPIAIPRAGEPLRGGTVYLAPDAVHLEVARDGTARLTGGAPVSGFRPSATVLFRSLAAAFGDRAAAVVLSGMGDDGVEGARAVRQAGGKVLAQDEETSRVYGMPRAVAAAELPHLIGPVEHLAHRIAQIATMRSR